eukprot:scaffold110648_cov62-Attheya_sp.AAC.3
MPNAKLQLQKKTIPIPTANLPAQEIPIPTANLPVQEIPIPTANLPVQEIPIPTANLPLPKIPIPTAHLTQARTHTAAFASILPVCLISTPILYWLSYGAVICVASLVGPFDEFRDRRLLAIIDGVLVCSTDGAFESMAYWRHDPRLWAHLTDLVMGAYLLSSMVSLYAPSWMDCLRMVENCTRVGTFDGLSKGCLVGLLDGVLVGIMDAPWDSACDGFIDVSFDGVTFFASPLQSSSTSLRAAAAAANGAREPNRTAATRYPMYQKQEEKYTQYTSISTTMTTGSPTRYKSYDDLLDRLDEITKRTEAQRKKLQDNFNETLREMYEDNIKQLQSINDPDAQYQKQDENDIQCKLDTTIISTTTGTSPTRYDLQGIYNSNKQYREAQTTRVINLQSSAHHANDRQEDNIV